ncbi:gremlin-1-like [Bacillus rossius redtenbacheri]|uniref:gremlin-1-like n=1 Tax=Bacillus rossius redtenbacheri TaxID=93214 RepID=UPI002FDE73D7
MWPPRALWAACLLAGLRGAQASSESIMDMINTQEVERFLAQRAHNASREQRRFLQQNALDESEADGETPPPAPLGPGPGKGSLAPLPPPPPPPAGNSSAGLDKLLRSSKTALEVTTRDYLKRDWCKTEPLVQRVREDGCLTRTIVNRFCYGQCNSFYIPRSPRRRGARRRDPGDEEAAAAFRSCAFCKPKLASWITVTLRCPSSVPALRRKRVQRVKQCKCIAELLH